LNALLMGSDFGGVHSSVGAGKFVFVSLGALVVMAPLARARLIFLAIFRLCSFLLRRWIFRRCRYVCLLALLACSAAAMGMRKLMLPLPCIVVDGVLSRSSTCRGGGAGCMMCVEQICCDVLM